VGAANPVGRRWKAAAAIEASRAPHFRSIGGSVLAAHGHVITGARAVVPNGARSCDATAVLILDSLLLLSREQNREAGLARNDYISLWQTKGYKFANRAARKHRGRRGRCFMNRRSRLGGRTNAAARRPSSRHSLGTKPACCSKLAAADRVCSLDTAVSSARCGVALVADVGLRTLLAYPAVVTGHGPLPPTAHCCSPRVGAAATSRTAPQRRGIEAGHRRRHSITARSDLARYNVHPDPGPHWNVTQVTRAARALGRIR